MFSFLFNIGKGRIRGQRANDVICDDVCEMPKLAPSEAFKEAFGFNEPEMQGALKSLSNVQVNAYQASNFPDTEEFHPYSYETNYEQRLVQQSP